MVCFDIFVEPRSLGYSSCCTGDFEALDWLENDARSCTVGCLFNIVRLYVVECSFNVSRLYTVGCVHSDVRFGTIGRLDDAVSPCTPSLSI